VCIGVLKGEKHLGEQSGPELRFEVLTLFGIKHTFIGCEGMLFGK
jgi:hypothetical protein